MLLTWPYALGGAPVVAGGERCFEPVNEAHGRFWTTCYPTAALFPMAALVRHAGHADYSCATVATAILNWANGL